MNMMVSFAFDQWLWHFLSLIFIEFYISICNILYGAQNLDLADFCLYPDVLSAVWYLFILFIFYTYNYCYYFNYSQNTINCILSLDWHNFVDLSATRLAYSVQLI